MLQQSKAYFVNINLIKKEKVLFELINVLFLLVFYIPLFIAILYDLKNVFYLIGVIFVFISIPVNFFNRIFPNGKIIFNDNEKKIKIVKRDKILLVDYKEIINVEVMKSNEYFMAYSSCTIKLKDKMEIILFIDKFYFTNPKKASNEIDLKFKDILSAPYGIPQN